MTKSSLFETVYICTCCILLALYEIFQIVIGSITLNDECNNNYNNSIYLIYIACSMFLMFIVFLKIAIKFYKNAFIDDPFTPTIIIIISIIYYIVNLLAIIVGIPLLMTTNNLHNCSSLLYFS